MKNLKKVLGIGIIAIAGFLVVVAADHIDAPAVQGGNSDVTDFYAFQGENTNNMVFVANVQGLLSPAATSNASFSENVLIEFNIDNDGDFVEDLVIQAIPRNGKMYFFGPVAPSQTGLNSTIAVTSAVGGVVDITTGSNAVVATNAGMSFFAGPRDDPFFFDFAQYSQIIGGMATSFNNPGSDTFAGSNVLSVVVEVPKSLIGGSGTINTWVESKTK
ncbi:molecular chaperone DnaK [Confluentibacter flavum]|uniref:Molecular chaperone DnaK n=1 Tax=Confluentibacter flavum TaxID=1909700 RepID=A0A2N3HIN3_9FLAO|nr:molecular chaperone DnaK [Confluentibacter flavum]